jgi:hypothetical protein
MQLCMSENIPAEPDLDNTSVGSMTKNIPHFNDNILINKRDVSENLTGITGYMLIPGSPFNSL